jgi:hypothetical protein
MRQNQKIHRHHIIENRNGVRVRTDKIIELTIEEHSQIHKEYFEKWGFWEDKLAYEGLGGYKGREELIWEAQSKGGKEGRRWQIERGINVWDSETAKKYSTKAHDSLEKKYGYRNGNWKGRKHKTSSKIKIGQKSSIHQEGSGNSQYGTFWITDGINNKKCRDESLIPKGWKKGRKGKGVNQH